MMIRKRLFLILFSVSLVTPFSFVFAKQCNRKYRKLCCSKLESHIKREFKKMECILNEIRRASHGRSDDRVCCHHIHHDSLSHHHHHGTHSCYAKDFLCDV